MVVDRRRLLLKMDRRERHSSTSVIVTDDRLRQTFAIHSLPLLVATDSVIAFTSTEIGTFFTNDNGRKHMFSLGPAILHLRLMTVRLMF